ncbi:hypothetical protein [Kocuria sp. KRD140]|uniref:hypothetical protein n=1 Tax=Kocuria sp. KRD140 TaxID=2729723 RepID=UPI0019D16CAD|nr:hypothetical protein [Kocuria sp. KRD140]
MSLEPQSREQTILSLLSRDYYNLHELGENPRLAPALEQLVIVLDDQQPDYTWASVTSDAWNKEAGELHVLAGNTMFSTGYGSADSRAVRIEPLSLVDLDVKMTRTPPSVRIPGGVEKVNVTLNRDGGRQPIKLKAQSLQDDESVQALLDLVRALASRLG